MEERKKLRKQAGGSLEKLKKMNLNEVCEIVGEETAESPVQSPVHSSRIKAQVREQKLLSRVESLIDLQTVVLEKKPDLKIK